MDLKQRMQVIFKTTLEEGLVLLLHSLKAIVVFLGVPFMMAAAAYRLRMPSEEERCSSESNFTKQRERTTCVASKTQDMITTDIKQSDQGASWTILFGDEMQKSRRMKPKLMQRKTFYDHSAPVPILDKGLIESDCRKLIERAHYQCFLATSMAEMNSKPKHENTTIASPVNLIEIVDDSPFSSDFDTVDDDDSDDDSDNDSDDHSDDDSDNDSDAEYESDMEENESPLDDSDDLEVVFDDTPDSAINPKEPACPMYIQKSNLFNMNKGFDDLPDFGRDKILPFVTKECISVRASDVLNGPNNILDGTYRRKNRRGSIESLIATSQSTDNLFQKKHNRDAKGKPIKKMVSFAEHENLVTVHPMVSWNFAYRKARKGPWERYACDRFHFKRRIQSCEQILGPMLQKKYNQYLNQTK